MAVCGPKTHRIANVFDQRQTSIIAEPQNTFKREISPRMLLEMNISSSHVQNTFLQTLWYGNWTRGVGSEVKFPSTEGGSVKKENPQQTFPVVVVVWISIIVLLVKIIIPKNDHFHVKILEIKFRLIWLSHPQSREIWPATNAVSSCRITVSGERKYFGHGFRKCSFSATCVEIFRF